MKIAIDGRSLNWVDSGFKTYALGLMGGLMRIDHQNEYIIYLDRPLENPTWTTGVNFHERVLRKGLTGFTWKQIKLPFDAMMNRRKLDIFHFLCNSPSFTCPGALVYTIHDLSFKIIKGKVPFRHHLSLSLQMPLGAKKARVIITESLSAKNDICNFFGVDPDKIVVIPAGVDQHFTRIFDTYKLDETSKKYNLPERFILYLGSFLPHKNLPILLQAYHLLPCSLRKDYQLVLAGCQDWNFTNIKRDIAELGLEDQIFFPGPILFKDLPSLYNLAELFVFPSLYEGFGLPVLEAMACGLPVIASDNSSIPEVLGSAGNLVPPRDADAWMQVIRQVLTTPGLQTEMAAKGLERSSRFNWDETARRTLAVYESLM